MTHPALLPPNESERLQALRDRGVLDTEPELAFDQIVALASQLCGTPIALISLVDEHRQWFKASVGVDAKETSRDMAFCAHAILQPEQVFEVPSARLDPRFQNNPLVTGDLGIQFYAGAPLNTADGHSLGTLCVIDREPKSLSGEKQLVLQALAKQVVALMDLAMVGRELDLRNRELEAYQEDLRKHQMELEHANRRLEEQSRTDPLTGLLNRRGLDAVLVREVGRSARYHQPVAMIMLDVDHFKGYNDRFGHPAGDVALATISALIQETVRETDSASRFGGEEFAIVLSDTSAQGALVIAERLRARIEGFEWPLRPVTVSLGVAAVPQHACSPEVLLQAADAALYGAKESGRNCVQVSTTAFNIALTA